MKKALALFLTGSMAISMLTGCGTANSKDMAQQSPDTSAASTDVLNLFKAAQPILERILPMAK